MNYKVDEIVQGTVSGIQPYGAFIKFDDNEQGLIHISEISSYFVKDIEKLIDQKIEVVKNNPFPQTDNPMNAKEKQAFEKEKNKRKQEFFANRNKNKAGSSKFNRR